jgi:hypothetical protein
MVEGEKFNLKACMKFTRNDECIINLIICEVCNRKFNIKNIEGHMKWEFLNGNLKSKDIVQKSQFIRPSQEATGKLSHSLDDESIHITNKLDYIESVN